MFMANGARLGSREIEQQKVFDRASSVEQGWNAHHVSACFSGISYRKQESGNAIV